LTTWKYSKLWILLHSIWWPLHIFLIVLCGIVYTPCQEETIKLKNQLVLSKCINYESWFMKISRICMKGWRIQLCSQYMFLLVNFTKQN
jgi:hypothetical protein